MPAPIAPPPVEDLAAGVDTAVPPGDSELPTAVRPALGVEGPTVTPTAEAAVAATPGAVLAPGVPLGVAAAVVLPNPADALAGVVPVGATIALLPNPADALAGAVPGGPTTPELRLAAVELVAGVAPGVPGVPSAPPVALPGPGPAGAAPAGAVCGAAT
jgi:hypothetical protein